MLGRTKEIGVRQAIGARRADIRLLLLIGAVAISALDGQIGVGLGFVIAKLVVFFAGWSTIITMVHRAGLRRLDSGRYSVRLVSGSAGFAAESD